MKSDTASFYRQYQTTSCKFQGITPILSSSSSHLVLERCPSRIRIFLILWLLVSIHSSSASEEGFHHFLKTRPQLWTGPQCHHVVNHPGQLHYSRIENEDICAIPHQSLISTTQLYAKCMDTHCQSVIT